MMESTAGQNRICLIIHTPDSGQILLQESGEQSRYKDVREINNWLFYGMFISSQMGITNDACN